MNTKDHDLFDLSTVERDSRHRVDWPAQLTVDFSHIPAAYANEFPDKTVIFTDIQIFERGSQVTFSATYMPDHGSYWEFLIATPKSIGSHIIGPSGPAVAALRRAGSDMQSLDYDTVELVDYATDKSYEVKLVNAGQSREDGFEISIAYTLDATDTD
jgi:hypothetical protein